jgi:menaquinone-dependent protoporphyrinogen oxidase
MTWCLTVEERGARVTIEEGRKGVVRMTVLVAYSSKHGSTEGIAHAIADRLRELGEPAEVGSVDEIRDVAEYRAIVLGSAVYAGSWMKEAVEFVHRFAEALAERPVWLFSSGPLGTDVEDDEEQPRQLGEMRGVIGPIDHRMFFGALDRSALGFGERMIVKAVKAPDGDFRDWDAIRDWADDIARELSVDPGTER